MRNPIAKRLASIVLAVLFTVIPLINFSAYAAADSSVGDPYVIFKKSLDKMCALKYAELKGAWRQVTSYGDRTETGLTGIKMKLMVSSDNKTVWEGVEWGEASKITSHYYINDGYFYESVDKTTFAVNWGTMGAFMCTLVGATPDSYKDDLKNLTAKKIPGGYELSYKRPHIIYDNYRYAVVLDDEYMIKSVKTSYRLDHNTDLSSIYTTKYEFVSANKPFTIALPRDLHTYEVQPDAG